MDHRNKRPVKKEREKGFQFGLAYESVRDSNMRGYRLQFTTVWLFVISVDQFVKTDNII